MNKISRFLKSFFFISIWLMISSYFIDFWNTFHWEYIYLKLNSIFDKGLWLILKRNLYGIDIGYWLEEALKFISYEIPKESFKYLPIYYFLKRIWIKK